ncbi:GPW/gp25 family protein [Deinococcus cellulosilyticus]|uniref:LysM domain-containing protein n=1 Tax=Deinococcus cellulosilyticus (strain DSM 18568 / NBRC 106333 / KACC 11606 / 5516J-15) TaxID=1223518 RepID=A0A511N764_DEIC1|nr:GPW/gp25 family protein [Deinococcus cellulosilyticus]GEM48670.1 hypothetical protein DC3_43050 [Deinococcus cellulosilyticus NBRC 106333 = KACC 11606]
MITTIQQGDNPVTLALRHYQNPERWTDIVEANGLRLPFIVSNPQEYPDRKVLGYGDAILIPEDPPTQPLTPLSAEVATYGQDWFWDEDTFQIIRPGMPVTLDRGINNLRKALLRRLITYPGELPADPNYGCRIADHLGESATVWRAELAALDVVETLYQDPRVKTAFAMATYLPEGELFAAALVEPIPPAESFALNLRVGGQGVRF